jgi:glucose/arabinose dehydrogenase
MKTKPVLFLFSLLINLSSCSAEQKDKKATPPPVVEAADLSEKIELRDFFPALRFSKALLMLPLPQTNNEFFIVEQSGLIKHVDTENSPLQATIFADLREFITSSRGELGLLGMALSPDYLDTGDFFVSYTKSNPIGLVIAKLKRSENNPLLADLNSRETILELNKDFANYTNHNGGMLSFGTDSLLYIGVGDGGGSGDRFGNAQNGSTLWGKLLRIDVLNTPPYQIPTDNPFVNDPNISDEIWALGLRNPWRFSFDTLTEKMFLADVGQNRSEEINIVEKAGNYGWNIFEANTEFRNPDQLAPSDFNFPVWSYPRSQGRSITGGFVYRGHDIPELSGHYVYGDYISGKIWALELSNTSEVIENHSLAQSRSISSFAQDNNGEIYVISYSQGKIFKIIPKL